MLYCLYCLRGMGSKEIQKAFDRYFRQCMPCGRKRRRVFHNLVSDGYIVMAVKGIARCRGDSDDNSLFRRLTVKYEHNFYITKDKLLDIEFLFIDLGEEIGWRGYVLSDIDYKQFSDDRSDGYEETHLYIDTNRHRYIDVDKDFPYICWTKPVHDLDTMRELAMMWAEITAYYIRNGGDFETIQKKLKGEGVI